jgi:hypothetical protein
MKDEYKFLIELCNSHKPEKDFEWEFTRTTTGNGYGTDKSEFVETLLMLVTELDKNFPRRDFLKQVKCHYRSGTLIDGEYSKWRDKEYKKEEKEKHDLSEESRKTLLRFHDDYID